ncbi:MAG: hypothetical protein QHH15_07240, partial [Candidatus Thermoplasmatota archaeon]|nr:hypothetical protein [Candidatus Thermoplasmatota archaeon]
IGAIRLISSIDSYWFCAGISLFTSPADAVNATMLAKTAQTNNSIIKCFVFIFFFLIFYLNMTFFAYILSENIRKKLNSIPFLI